MTTHTTSPIVTGTSVLAVKYKDGVLLSADCLASYGSLARYRDISRFHPVGKHTVIGASGEMSDFQYIQDELDALMRGDRNVDVYPEKSPTEIHQWITRKLYQRRSKLNPLWNHMIVAGVDEKHTAFIGLTDLLGTSITADYIATGFGQYLAVPYMRSHWRDGMTRDEAKQLLDDVQRVLLYRDARTINKIQTADVTVQGVVLSEPYELATEWSLHAFVQPVPNDVPQRVIT